MRADVIEIVHDAQLKKREKEIAKIIRDFYPGCGPVKLYKTADGRIGFLIQMMLTPEKRKDVDKVYRAVTKCLNT